MSLNWLAVFLALGSWLAIAPIQAVSPSNSGSGSNTYLFIENNIDNEYFITPGSRNPRFSGSNVWTRYSTNQRSLGYLGYSNWSYSSRYFDMWLSDSPITEPFAGIRCMTSGSTCPSTGFIPAEYTDREGFYHTMSNSSTANGNDGLGSLTLAAFEYFRNKPVGSVDSLVLNLCYTTTNYDYISGIKCRDLESGANWRYYTVNLTKVGHLTLKSTGAMADIWVASDGSPSISNGGELCEIAVINSTSGIVCKMVSYSLQETSRITSSLKFEMVIDTAALGFSPGSRDIMYSGDGSDWTRYSSSTTYDKVFSTTRNYVYVFLSNAFFLKTLNAGTDLTNKDSLFTFYFDNSNTPQSGYYQFTASNLINIIPKEYGISIQSTDSNSNSKQSGTIGSEKPIAFEYKVTTSSSRQADSITAQVMGDSTTIGGVPYCLFSSVDGNIRVPIPAYLSYTSQFGTTVTERNSCGEAPINMTSANWVQTVWNASVDDGFFFTTKLKLLFPMNDSRSMFTTEGHDWMGTVNASGEIRVTATWVGVTR